MDTEVQAVTPAFRPFQGCLQPVMLSSLRGAY